MKYKFGWIGPKIKTSLNLHEYLHTRQFEDSKCRYNNKRVFKFKSKFENVQYLINLKIFEDVLSHLHGNYKQDNLGWRRSKFREISHLKSILEGWNLHTSECNSTKYKFVTLQCYR